MTDINATVTAGQTINATITQLPDINITLDKTGPQGPQGDAGTTDYDDLTNKPTTISAQQSTDIATNNDKVSYSKTNVMGEIVHGSTAGTTRPTGFGVVTWIGSVEPTNAINNDVWVDTA